MSTTPGTNMIYLGEARKDVLGAHRIPGPSRWDITMAEPLPIEQATLDQFGDPKTTFVHKKGAIIDEDDPDADFHTTVTYDRGTKKERSISTRPQLLKRRNANTLSPEMRKKAGGHGVFGRRSKQNRIGL
jgi:hypothetical protein